MSDAPSLSGTLGQLREEFDKVFASPANPSLGQTNNLLAVRVAGIPYAIRMREIAGLYSKRKVVPLPSPSRALLGIAGVRGEIIPVYSLAALLGHPQDQEQTKWIALCGSGETAGLAFSQIEGYFPIDLADIHEANEAVGGRVHVREVAQFGGIVRAVLDVPSVLETIKKG